MKLLSRLFGQKAPAPRTAAPPQQAVLLYLDGTGLPQEVYTQFDLATLEGQLAETLAATGAGEYDGNEVHTTEAVLFLYGPDAEQLYGAIEPVVRRYPLCRNARVVIRKGGPGAPQRETRIPAA